MVSVTHLAIEFFNAAGQKTVLKVPTLMAVAQPGEVTEFVSCPPGVIDTASACQVLDITARQRGYSLRL